MLAVCVMSGRMLERGATIREKVTYVFRVLPPSVSPLYGSVDVVCSLLNISQNWH